MSCVQSCDRTLGDLNPFVVCGWLALLDTGNEERPFGLDRKIERKPLTIGRESKRCRLVLGVREIDIGLFARLRIHGLVP